MTNLEKYNAAFCNALGVAEKDLPDLKYEGIDAWDSVGHVILTSNLESAFDVVFELADIMKFRTYAGGIEILESYGVKFD